MEVSIIIVHYNTPDLLKKCLESIYTQNYNFTYEVIVLDNASKSLCGITEDFPQVRIIRNNTNRGFAKANNQGLKSATGSYILFLNPDTEIRKGSLENMLKFIRQNVDIGVVGPKLIYPDGTLQLSCRRFYSLRAILMKRIPLARRLFNRRILDGHLMLEDGYDSIKEVDWLIGACLMIPRDLLNKIRGFDEGYRLYFEDVDLCYRIKKQGLRIVYYPDSTVIHHHRRDSAKGLSLKTVCHIFSSVRFFIKFGWVF